MIDGDIKVIGLDELYFMQKKKKKKRKKKIILQNFEQLAFFKCIIIFTF